MILQIYQKSTRAFLSKRSKCLIICTLISIGPKRDENVEWRILHNEELHSLYRSLHILRVIKSRSLRWADHVARMEEVMSDFKILIGTLAGKRPLGRPRPKITG